MNQELPLLIMRPSLAAWFRSLWVKASVAPLVLLAILLVPSRDHVALNASLAGVVLLAALLGQWQYTRSVLIITDGTTLRITSWLGQETVFPRREVGGVALREIRGTWGRRRPLFIVYDRTHRSLGAFDRRLFRDEDVRQLVAVLCRRTPASRVTSYARLAEEFPGSVAWWQHASPVVVLTLTVALVVIATVISVALGIR